MKRFICCSLFLVIQGFIVSINAQEPYAHKVHVNYPKSVFWGDTHLHTNLSMDAYYFSNRSLGPDEAYLFAKGNPVQANNGMIAQLDRPLDFLVIAEHASNAGVMQGIGDGNPELLSGKLAQQWRQRLKAINQAKESNPAKYIELSSSLFMDGFKQGTAGNDAYNSSVWKENGRLADLHNDPGKFTAFIGYEWTPVLYWLHRVVIFKDGADKTSKVVPFSNYDSNDPEKLWEFLGDYENQAGGEVLSIPHNGNLS